MGREVSCWWHPSALLVSSRVHSTEDRSFIRLFCTSVSHHEGLPAILTEFSVTLAMSSVRG